MVNLLLQKNNPAEQIMDMYVWFWLQGWFMPYYVIGKQDEWKDWVGSSLNGWKHFNICKS
jgi:hypothetical protein